MLDWLAAHGNKYSSHFGVEIGHPAEFYFGIMRFSVKDFPEFVNKGRFYTPVLIGRNYAHQQAFGPGHGFALPVPKKLEQGDGLQFAVDVLEQLVQIGKHQKDGDGFFFIISQPNEVFVEYGTGFFECLPDVLWIQRLKMLFERSPGLVEDLRKIGYESFFLFPAKMFKGILGLCTRRSAIFPKRSGKGRVMSRWKPSIL